MKAKVELMALNQGDGDVSNWARELFRRTWALRDGSFDCTAETAKGYSFGYVDVAPKASPLPRWEIHELTAKGPRRIGAVDVHHPGPPVFSSSVPPSDRLMLKIDRLMLKIGWDALVRKFGVDVVAQRPRARR